MSRRQTWACLAVFLLCSGILVLFTDVEVSLRRWWHCGPLATGNDNGKSDLCS
ncbi:MAG: hypothetical protein ACON4T_06945 [Synechococcus sp.]